MWCVCAQSYMVQSKKIFDHFICFWKWFLSLFVFMFSVYFVFHCLLCFSLFKHVLYWKTGVRVFRGSTGNSPVAKPQSQAHPEAFGDSLAACSRLTRDSRKFSRLKLATRGLLKIHSFVRLYLFKCDVCVLNYIWINPKIFLIILYAFGSDFYHSLCSC